MPGVRTWMIYFALGLVLDAIGLATLLTHLGKTLGVGGMMVGLLGVVMTRSGLLTRRAKAANATPLTPRP